ncbi:MAG: LCP family protein [Candidatus Spechtbacteria bacterium]|nr:LCP family protein [Candidatus Spechtbacteria bacterium]
MVSSIKKVSIPAIILLILSGVFFFYHAARTVQIVGSERNGNVNGIAAIFPGIPIPETDRIDILILGIRGLGDDPKEENNGELLADSIILLSYDTKRNKASIVSIPRDLYAEIPGYGKEKINAAYAIGEDRNYGYGRKGLELSEALLSVISGVYIDYAMRIDFDGFKKIIDQLGGITIHRDSPFEEPRQWIHDGKNESAYWRLDQAGWTFYVPKGSNLLTAEDALYYARSRYSSTDFDRMARQQEVIAALKTKALSLGVLANPVKIFQILDVIKDHVRTDMPISKIKELVELARKAKIQDYRHEVLTSGEGGLLYEDSVDGRFVLLPKDGDYSKIQEFFKSILE